jgi:hypothetical protein
LATELTTLRPSAVSWDENRIDVLALGTNDQLLHKTLLVISDYLIFA